jgi:phosphoglycerate dehydrogenase-like enzyme
MTRIAVLDDYQRIAPTMADWGRLPADCSVEFFTEHLLNEEIRAQTLEPFEIIVAMRERTPFPAALLARLPNLRLLVTTGMRNAAIDTTAAVKYGITVCGTRGQRTATAELTWGLILSLARHIPAEDRAMRAGGWQSTIGPSLEGKVLGVIGLGNLGSQVAAVGKTFGMDIVAWSQNLTAERAAQHGAHLVSKDDLLAQSDIVTVHLVLSERTRGLIGRRELALMKPSAYLVNTSRGPIVEEATLIEALSSGAIAAAALDVYDQEPLPIDHPLRRLPNTVLTPHLGYVTTDGYRIFYGDAVEDIVAFLGGDRVRVIPG